MATLPKATLSSSPPAQLPPPRTHARRTALRSTACRQRCPAAGAQLNSGLGLLSFANALLPQSALVGAAKTAWHELWLTLMRELAPQSSGGAYVRPRSTLVSQVPAGDVPLVLYVGNACPWCHRTRLVLALRGLTDVRVVELHDDAERASRCVLRRSRTQLFLTPGAAAAGSYERPTLSFLAPPTFAQYTTPWCLGTPAAVQHRCLCMLASVWR